MEEDHYDAGSDVEGIFPEEFRKHVRDQNLICHYPDHRNSLLVFKSNNRSDADRDLMDKLESLFETFNSVPDQCLVQFWRAEQLTGVDDFGGRWFRLTTHNQPFMLVGSCYHQTPISEGICSYRMKMVDIITGDEGGKGGGGVIGRVFRNKRMEWTPDIGYYSDEEHPHLDLALSWHIMSSLAFPLSDSSGHSVGVVEMVSLMDWFFPILELNFGTSLKCKDCHKYEFKQCDSEYLSRIRAVSEIMEVMQVVGRSCCIVHVQTWMLCNHCSYLSISERFDYNLSACYVDECFEDGEDFVECEFLCTVEKGEGVVGKAAASSHNLVYCDDVSQFSIPKYPLAHFARRHKLTASFATCLQSNCTGNQIYVLEFFLNSSEVNGRDPRAMLVPILEGMRKNFRTFKFASGEELGDNLSVQVIDARFPDKFEILEIGRLDSVENHTFEMDLIHNDVNVVNTIEEGGVAVALLDKQQPVPIDGLAIDNGQNMISNTNQRYYVQTSNDERNGELDFGVIGSDFAQRPLVELNVIHTEGNIVGASEECIINSSKLPARNGIDISLEELEEVSGMKRDDAAKRLKVSVSTFKRVCRDYKISRWPPRKKNLDQTRFGNSPRTGSTKQLRGSAPTVQNESLVMIKAKYGDNFIKFELSASSGINAFNQEVSKRLNLEAGSYVAKYQDDDNDWILVKCDDDLRHYISNSASLGKTTLAMLLEYI